MIKAKVLGTGCSKCEKLYLAVEAAAQSGGVSVQIEKVDQLSDILKYDILVTPALIIEGQLKSSGSVPRQAQLIEWLRAGAQC